MAAQLAKDIAILAQWLKNDILSVTGPNFSSRLELLKFVATMLFPLFAMVLFVS